MPYHPLLPDHQPPASSPPTAEAHALHLRTSTMQDEEKYAAEPKVAAAAAASGASDDDVPPYNVVSSPGKGGLLAKLRGFENALDRKLGVESHGIERRRPEDRDPAFASWSHQTVMFLMWMSATTNLSCFTTGFLGWELGLDLWRCLVIIIFSSFIGAAVTVSQSLHM